MSVQDNLALFQQVDRAFSVQDYEKFDRLHAEHVTVSGAMMPEPTKGRVAHHQSMEAFFKAFPDMRIDKDYLKLFGEGDQICAVSMMRGTHLGPLTGSHGQTYPPSGKTFAVQLCTVAKIEHGEITEEWVYFDSLSLMSQLGLL